MSDSVLDQETRNEDLCSSHRDSVFGLVWPDDEDLDCDCKNCYKNCPFK
jgi:hypothetical protein